MACCSSMPNVEPTERPTCRTCPHYLSDHTGGECRLHPTPIDCDASHWCGQHPAMFAWHVARLRRPDFVTIPETRAD